MDDSILFLSNLTEFVNLIGHLATLKLNIVLDPFSISDSFSPLSVPLQKFSPVVILAVLLF